MCETEGTGETRRKKLNLWWEVIYSYELPQNQERDAAGISSPSFLTLYLSIDFTLKIDVVGKDLPRTTPFSSFYMSSPFTSCSISIDMWTTTQGEFEWTRGWEPFFNFWQQQERCASERKRWRRCHLEKKLSVCGGGWGKLDGDGRRHGKGYKFWSFDNARLRIRSPFSGFPHLTSLILTSLLVSFPFFICLSRGLSSIWTWECVRKLK